MRRLDQPAAGQDQRRRFPATEEERERALLAQFMRHDSVASLANAIAKHAGVRGEDLIAAAGLDLRRSDSSPGTGVTRLVNGVEGYDR
jgi:hypothetical protein